MPYNLTEVAQNSTSLLGMFQVVNNGLMDGWLGLGIVIVLSFVFLGAFITQTNNIKVASAATGFIMATLTLLLYAVGLVSQLVMFTVCILAAAAIAFSIIRS